MIAERLKRGTFLIGIGGLNLPLEVFGNMMRAPGQSQSLDMTAMNTALPRGSDTNHLSFGVKTPARVSGMLQKHSPERPARGGIPPSAPIPKLVNRLRHTLMRASESKGHW